jgi:dUTP pyrophosphatase
MQQKLDVKITKLVPEATIPQYSREGDVGLDLVATSKRYDERGNVVYGTGLAIEIPEGYYADLRARSSVANYDLVLSNGVGTIDANYRGELLFKFKPVLEFWSFDESQENAVFETASDEHRGHAVGVSFYNIGDRIGQLVIKPYPLINLIEVESLSESNRGTAGFGSSGK